LPYKNVRFPLFSKKGGNRGLAYGRLKTKVD
jgi:hypothetical protein